MSERGSLQRAVESLAKAITDGTVRPKPDELRALAVCCDNANLAAEAARVRRWLKPLTRERVHAFMSATVEDLR